jgi:hypothetical protein
MGDEPGGEKLRIDHLDLDPLHLDKKTLQRFLLPLTTLNFL